MVRRVFRSNGIGFVEICIAWCRNNEDFRDRVEFHGLENLEAATAQGRGVLLFGAHLTTFEISGFLDLRILIFGFPDVGDVGLGKNFPNK